MHIKSRLIKCCCLKVSTNMIISWWDIMDKKFRQMNNLVSTDSLVHYAENGGNIRKQYLIFTGTSQIRSIIMGKLPYNWNYKESNSYISSSLSIYLKITKWREHHSCSLIASSMHCTSEQLLLLRIFIFSSILHWYWYKSDIFQPNLLKLI